MQRTTGAGREPEPFARKRGPEDAGDADALPQPMQVTRLEPRAAVAASARAKTSTREIDAD